MLELFEGQRKKFDFLRLQPPGHETRSKALELRPSLPPAEFQVQIAKQLTVPIFELIPIFKRDLKLRDLQEQFRVLIEDIGGRKLQRKKLGQCRSSEVNADG